MNIDKILNNSTFAIIDGNYECDSEKKEKFKKAVDIADKLNTQGLCVYKYDDPEKPLTLHCLQIRWSPKGDEEMVQVKAKEIANLMDSVDEFITDKFLPLDWQLSTEIYKRV